MADDKKTIGPDVGTPTEAPEQPSPAPNLSDTTSPAPLGPEELTVEEQLILEHEGQAVLFEMGKAIPDAPESPSVTIPEQPVPDKDDKQTASPGKDDPDPAPTGKVVDFAAVREEAGKTKLPVKEAAPPNKEGKKPEQHRRGRPSKGDKAAPSKTDPSKEGKAAPDKAKPPKPRDKKSQSKPAPEKPATDKGGAPAGTEVTQEPSTPRDATRAEKEEIVYLNLSDLHPFKNHPFGVRDDAEMQGLVESVKAAGVNQPALVRPREDGGYEIIAGHRRQRASELAGFANMPCMREELKAVERLRKAADQLARQEQEKSHDRGPER